jgi:hypothetical protein
MRCGMSKSRSQDSRTLNRLAITHKAVAKEVMERNEHATWQVVMAQYDVCQLVFVGEAGGQSHKYSDKWLGSAWVSAVYALDDFSARAEMHHSSRTYSRWNSGVGHLYIRGL